MRDDKVGGNSSIFALMLLAVSFAAIAALSLLPGERGPVAALFPPDRSVGQVLAAVIGADARLVRFGAWDWIVVVADDAPGLSERMRAAGAWAIVNPYALGGCSARAPGGGKP